MVKILGRKLRDANFGTHVAGRKFRDASCGKPPRVRFFDIRVRCSNLKILTLGGLKLKILKNQCQIRDQRPRKPPRTLFYKKKFFEKNRNIYDIRNDCQGH